MNKQEIKTKLLLDWLAVLITVVTVVGIVLLAVAIPLEAIPFFFLHTIVPIIVVVALYHAIKWAIIRAWKAWVVPWDEIKEGWKPAKKIKVGTGVVAVLLAATVSTYAQGNSGFTYSSNTSQGYSGYYRTQTIGGAIMQWFGANFAWENMTGDFGRFGPTPPPGSTMTPIPKEGGRAGGGYPWKLQN